MNTFSLSLKNKNTLLLAIALLASVSLKATSPAGSTTDPVDIEFSGPLAVVPEMVMVGDPGNAPDPLTGLGAVEDFFQISKYAITALQWSTFLNAVNVVQGNLQDPRNLYHAAMFSDSDPCAVLESMSGIVKKNIPNEYGLEIYEDKVTLFFPKNWGTSLGHYYGSLPITNISIDDCKRYCNWLHNGCPHFDELNATTLAYTETGAYDFTNGKQGELMPGAKYFLPTLNQSYKASYNKAGTTQGSYWAYPTQSDQLPYRSAYNEFGNINKTGANYVINGGWIAPKYYYGNPEGQRGNPLTTPVGFFGGSPGPYGTYDMGGNVRHWTSDVMVPMETGDSLIIGNLFQPIAPGGSYDETSDQLLSKNAAKPFASSAGNPLIGLRICALKDVASLAVSSSTGTFVPDPSKDTLLFESLKNVTFTQICAYGLESLFNARRAYAAGRDIDASVLIGAFTYQRNITNALVCAILAGTTTLEASQMNIKKADCWNIAFIIASTVITMIATESGAFLVEAFVGECLKALSSAGLISLTAQNTMEGATWQRLLVNVFYISKYTYSTTKSDLEYFNQQQKLNAAAQGAPQ